VKIAIRMCSVTPSGRRLVLQLSIPTDAEPRGQP
jgi:hypothetical protein